jgi:dihydropteroate synthase
MTAIMGIVNVTPDSFSDGGRYLDADAADRARPALRAAGADILDVGGESTRPGASASTRRGAARVLPVVAASPRTARRQHRHDERLDRARRRRAGARIVNDVSGGLADPEMLGAVAASGADVVLQHWRGPPPTCTPRRVRRRRPRRRRARGACAPRPRGDLARPGHPRSGHRLRQARRAELEALRALERIVAIGPRVLVGTSRKRFLAEALAPGADVSSARRDLATAVTSVLAAQAGAWAVRVHDVAATRDALAVWRLERRERRRTRERPITLTGVRAFGYHGVYEHERREGRSSSPTSRWSSRSPRRTQRRRRRHVHYGEVADQVAAVSRASPSTSSRPSQRIADALLGARAWMPSRSRSTSRRRPSRCRSTT